jgi:hypothetical protein
VNKWAKDIFKVSLWKLAEFIGVIFTKVFTISAAQIGNDAHSV